MDMDAQFANDVFWTTEALLENGGLVHAELDDYDYALAVADTIAANLAVHTGSWNECDPYIIVDRKKIPIATLQNGPLGQKVYKKDWVEQPYERPAIVVIPVEGDPDMFAICMLDPLWTLQRKGR
jgi:hypothetical protein